MVSLASDHSSDRPNMEYSRLAPDDAQRFIQILAQCFMSSIDRSKVYFDRIGIDQFRSIHQEGQLAGGLALLPMRQWWGGQRIAMTGIAAVGIAPEYRGSGAALSLLQNTLRELHQEAVPLSVLYPATQRLYRKVGYEQGGMYQGWSAATQAIQIKSTALPFQAIDPKQFDRLRPLQQQQARQNNAHLDRHAIVWQEKVDAEPHQTIHGYLIGSSDQPQGYVLFDQHSSQNETVLRVRDWAILSAEAGRSLWGFFASHRSQIHKIQWRGGAIDLLSLLLPEQSASPRDEMRWMLRIVHVPLALEKRGYPTGLELELHLEVMDDLLPENQGKFILSVSNGQGNVGKGGRGDLKLDIRGLAPLYTGLFTPQQLALMGYLDAPEAVLSIATQLFATGASPWMPDFF